MKNYSSILPCFDSLIGYAMFGWEMGDFCTELVNNNLVEACGRADDMNSRLIKEYACFIYNILPTQAWGSKNKVNMYMEERRKRVLHHSNLSLSFDDAAAAEKLWQRMQ